MLAHELFHFVEEKYKDEIFTKQEKIRLWSLGPLHNDSTVIVLSEIAAMAFAQAITGIPYPLCDGCVSGIWLFAGGSQRFI